MDYGSYLLFEKTGKVRQAPVTTFAKCLFVSYYALHFLCTGSADVDFVYFVPLQYVPFLVA